MKTLADYFSELNEFDHWTVDFRRGNTPEYGVDIYDDSTGNEWSILASMVDDSLEICLETAIKNARAELSKDKYD